MAHEIMYDPEDPLLARVREIALELSGSDMKVSHGRPAFFTKKIFTIYGAAVKADDGWTQHPQSILVLLDEDERASISEEPRSFVPAYWGPWGWLGIDLDKASDWTEIRELIHSSYLNTAPARLVAAYDQPS